MVSGIIGMSYEDVVMDSNKYYSFSGGLDGSLTELGKELHLPETGELSNFCIYVSSNDSVSNVVFTLRINRADTSNTITVPAGQVGFWSNTNSINVSKGDAFCFKPTFDAGADVRITSVSISIED